MIKVAVIGLGSMGKNHVRVYSELPNVEIVAVCDANEVILNHVAAKYGIKSYSDYHKLLTKEHPDAVSVAVPTALHEKVATEVMEAGAHVLVEKPIAATVEEGKRLIEKARSLERKLMVGHIVRFNPAMQLLKKKLDDGELGRIYQIVCRRAGPFPARVRDVGVVVDLAPHDVDIMRFLSGLEPIRVFAETEQRIHTEHEDLLLGLIRFPDGITGALEINWLSPKKIRETYVLGERGMFWVDDLMQDLYFYENEAANGELWSGLKTIKGVSEGSMIRFALKRYEPLKAELQSFLDALIEDAPIPVTGEDGLAALELALSLVESGRIGQSIEV
jgi:UDP-N-acetylglucosamine 3-dehydrogenase